MSSLRVTSQRLALQALAAGALPRQPLLPLAPEVALLPHSEPFDTLRTKLAALDAARAKRPDREMLLSHIFGGQPIPDRELALLVAEVQTSISAARRMAVRMLRDWQREAGGNWGVRSPLRLRVAQAVGRELLSVMGVEAVYLFGSVARGDDGPQSDINLYVQINPWWTRDQNQRFGKLLEGVSEIGPRLGATWQAPEGLTLRYAGEIVQMLVGLKAPRIENGFDAVHHLGRHDASGATLAAWSRNPGNWRYRNLTLTRAVFIDSRQVFWQGAGALVDHERLRYFWWEVDGRRHGAECVRLSQGARGLAEQFRGAFARMHLANDRTGRQDLTAWLHALSTEYMGQLRLLPDKEPTLCAVTDNENRLVQSLRIPALRWVEGQEAAGLRRVAERILQNPDLDLVRLLQD